MPWSNTRRGTHPKYNSREHRAARAAMKAQLERDGYAICAQDICLFNSRIILPGMQWCAGHDASGADYIGPVHRQCNESDAGRRGRARQNASRIVW
jgi:hypothetical protein